MFLFLTIVLSGVLAGAAYLFFRFRELPLICWMTPVKWKRRVVAGGLAAGLLLISLLRVNWISAFFLYLCMSYLFFDFTGLLLRKSRFSSIHRKFFRNGIPAWALALLICLGGYATARTIMVKEYEIAIAKPLADPLRIVFISDIHLGAGTGLRELERLLDHVNELKPDLVVLGGDIYDERTPQALMWDSFQIWEQMAGRYGVFYITGNHEYGSHGPGIDISELVKALEQHKVTPLLDRGLLIDDRFYLFGRVDRRDGRLDLESLLNGVDRQKPLILLDHQPVDLKNAILEKVDLELSGHTHAGQLFPFNFLVKFFYEKSYGLLKHNDYHLIVTSGFGSWGFPIRTTNFAEIVLVTVTGVPE